MIKPKKKICIDCGEESYIWAHGRCKLCDAKYRSNKVVFKPVEQRSQKSNTHIPLRTKKRSTQEHEYKKMCDEMDGKSGKKYCFFCGGEIKVKPDHHHLIGREGERLTDKKYLVHAHRECHDDYHHKSVHKIKWFLDFVNRLSDIDVDLAEKEMDKFNK